MAQLIFGKINVTKIDKSKLFKGEKGTYLDLTMWLNDKPDKYGNIISIQQSTKENEESIYIGEAKFYTPKEKTETSNESPPEQDDLPF